jgi:hypothetical protein
MAAEVAKMQRETGHDGNYELLKSQTYAIYVNRQLHK